MLWTGAIAAGAAYGGALAYMYARQGRLMYPCSEPSKPPGACGLDSVEEVRIETADGLHLLAWWRPPNPGRPVVLYWHGNGGPLHCRAQKFVLFGRKGYGMLMMAYRGYSGNPGQPSEARLVADAFTAAGWLARRTDAPVVYYGESLGGAVAMQLALRLPPRAIILEGAFDSAARVAQARYPIFPAARLIRDRWDTLSIAQACPAPVLMLHGRMDRTVPIHHAERLFRSLPEPKHFIRLEAGGHVDLIERGAGAPMLAWLAEQGL